LTGEDYLFSKRDFPMESLFLFFITNEPIECLKPSGGLSAHPYCPYSVFGDEEYLFQFTHHIWNTVHYITGKDGSS
jgi:hypothetical protein